MVDEGFVYHGWRDESLLIYFMFGFCVVLGLIVFDTIFIQNDLPRGFGGMACWFILTLIWVKQYEGYYKDYYWEGIEGE